MVSFRKRLVGVFVIVARSSPPDPMRGVTKRRGMNHDIIYVGVDVHEKESQLAALEKEGSILLEDRIPTDDLRKFISSLPGEKHVAIESVGFIHPIYEKLSSVPKCTVSVANPNKLRLISQSSTKNDSNDARDLGDPLRTTICYWTTCVARRPERSCLS